MNLSVKDIAQLLSVSEKTIYRMIQAETIPCFRVGGQWRFDRREIASWFEDTRTFSYKSAPGKVLAGEEGSILISEFIRKGGFYYDLPDNGSKEAAIQACLERIKTGIPQIDTRKLLDSILEREALCPTAVGNGIAFPHPQSFGKFTEVSYIALCRLERPISFGALDNEDVDTLFFIFPKSERRFLRIQAKLLRLLRDDEVLSLVKKVSSLDEICTVLSRKEAEIFK